MNNARYAPLCRIATSAMAVLLIAGLISFWPDLAGRVHAQADSASGQVTEEESGQSADDGSPPGAQFDEQIEQLAQFNPPPQLSDKDVGITVIPCDFGATFGADDVEGETYFCGIFTVPENWDDPDGPKLDLRFAVANAFAESSQPDPLIFLAGGPGQSAVATPIFAYDKLRTERDILRLDQRSTGFSQRLGLEECLVLASQNGVDDEDLDVLRTAVFPPLEMAEGETPTPLDAQIEAKAAVNRICWEQFSGQGLDLSHFTTAASVRDIVEFIKALEYEQFNIMEIGTGFPEVPGLDRSDPLQAFMAEAVVLVGGNIEMEVMFDFVGGVDEALAYAKLDEALQAFIEANYAGTTRDTLLQMLDALTAEEIASSPYLAEVQARIAPAEDLDEPDPESQEEAAVASQRLLAVLGLAEPLFNTIHCIEDIQFERIEDAISTFNDLAYPQFGSLDLAQTVAEVCRNWPVDPAPIEVKDPLSSTVPSLILQGAYDTRTPVIEATFVCPDGTAIDAVFDNGADTVTVALPDGEVTLPRTVSGSGARYSDDTTVFWNQGDEALVEVGGETRYEGCVAQE